MVFVTAGEGGGTGTGAAPVIAEIAKNEIGALTSGSSRGPFDFEGTQRGRARPRRASSRLRDSGRHADRDPEREPADDRRAKTSMVEAFKEADNVLRQGVQGITDLITIPGLINLDFADVRTIMTGRRHGADGHRHRRAARVARADAAQAAISSPLLEEAVDGATGILINITGGNDLGLFEVNEAAEIVQSAADPNANIIFGAVIDEQHGRRGARHRDRHRLRAAARDASAAKKPRADLAAGARTTERRTEHPGRERDRRERPRQPERSSLEIRDEDIDVPPFLR